MWEAMYWDFDPSNFRNWLINYSYKIIIYRPLVNIFVDLIENYCEKSPAFALILLYIPSIIFLKNKILNCELYPVLTGPVRTWHPQSACRYLPETFQTHSTHLPDTYHTNHWHLHILQTTIKNIKRVRHCLFFGYKLVIANLSSGWLIQLIVKLTNKLETWKPVIWHQSVIISRTPLPTQVMTKWMYIPLDDWPMYSLNKLARAVGVAVGRRSGGRLATTMVATKKSLFSF